MRIEEMLVREDFYPILKKTLEQYYRDIVKTPCQVEVTNRPGKGELAVYPKLNRIITKRPAGVIWSNTYSSFDVNDNRLKNLLGKIYITAALAGGGLLASKGLRLSDTRVFTDHHAIMPGNKKIRIVDFAKKSVDVVVKEGFRDDYFQKELSFRTKHRADYMVPIAAYGENWYREELIDGLCLARVRDKGLYSSCVSRVLACLRQIEESTAENVDSASYVHDLTQEIFRGLEQITAVKEDFACSLQQAWELVERLASRAKTLSTVPTMRSHGDMQSGNVLVDEAGKVYIIDWETVARRSIWYDPTTLLLFTRRLNRWKNIVENRNREDIKGPVLYLDYDKTRNMDGVTGVILLEDLAFRITDTLMIPGKQGSGSLNGFLKELEAVQV